MSKYHSLTAMLMLAGIFTWSLMSCTDDDEIYLQYNEHQNIVETSELTPYMDVNTFAGDDFYQYAVGKWLAENPLRPGEGYNGTSYIFDQKSANFLDDVKAIIASDEVFQRLKNDYDPSTGAADLNLLMQKLAAVDAVTTKEDMYKKMGELMIEGYYTPFILVPAPYRRRVEIAVLLPEPDNFTMEESMLSKHYNISETEAAQIRKVVNDWGDFSSKEKNASRNSSASSRVINEAFFPSRSVSVGRRAANTSPLFLMLQCTGYSVDEMASLIDSYKNINQYFSNMSLVDLKRLTKYMVINRDDDFIPKSKDGAVEDCIRIFLMGEYNPLNSRLSACFNKTIPTANRTAAVEMAKVYRESFRERINKLTWMSDESKAKAVEKLDAMTAHVTDQKETEVNDFCGRRLMESAAYCVMSTLLLRDSIETPDLFDKSLKVFLDYSRSQVEGHYSVVMTWNAESMEYYK